DGGDRRRGVAIADEQTLRSVEDLSPRVCGLLAPSGGVVAACGLDGSYIWFHTAVSVTYNCIKIEERGLAVNQANARAPSTLSARASPAPPPPTRPCWCCHPAAG